MGEFFTSLLALLVLIVLWMVCTALGIAFIVLVLRALGVIA